MNTTELIELARECCSYPVKVSDYHWCGEGEFIFTEAGLNAFAQRIEQPLYERIDSAAKVANAAWGKITDKDKQISDFESRLEMSGSTMKSQQHHIAELEKDCEILQTNLDAALMQVKQLREALQLIKIKDENKMYQSCPDCDYPGTCKSDMVCKSMPRSSIGNIAHKVLEQTK